VFTIDDLWRILKYLKDGTTDFRLSELTTTLATSEKEITNSFFENILDQSHLNSEDYLRLREMFIDWYSSHKTISTTQKHISDVHQMPNTHLSELFKSFGFGDPHWLQTEENIEQLIQTNKINLPSKSPYFSLSSIFALYSINISLSIMFRIVEDQFDRYTSSLDLPYNVPVKNLGTVLPILHIYVGMIYCFEKMFGYGVATSMTRYNCYSGPITYVGDPPLANNLSALTTIYETLIRRPDSRNDRDNRIEEIFNTWSRPMSQNFLNSLNAAEPLLQSMNSNFKDLIDSWFSMGNQYYLMTYLIGTLDNWIRLNIDSKSPSLVITMLGLGFRDELLKIINFFKPYRARLAFMDTAFSIKNPLTESVILDDYFFPSIEQFYHDHIRPHDGHCPEPSQIPNIDPETFIHNWLENNMGWDRGHFFDNVPSPPVIIEPPNPFPPNLCNNVEWLYDVGERYDIPMEYLNFKYDSGGYHDILPRLQKCLLELLKNHPSGGICDSVEYEIQQTFRDRVGWTRHVHGRTFDDGSHFDTEADFETQWLDSVELIPGIVPDFDDVNISDTSFHRIEITITDESIISDNFTIYVSFNASASCTTVIGPIPQGFDVGDNYDMLVDLDVTNTSNIQWEWLSATIHVCSDPREEMPDFRNSTGIVWIDPAYVRTYDPELIIGQGEELSTTNNIISNVEATIFMGILLDLSSSISINTESDALLYDGTFELLSAIICPLVIIYPTELTLGLIEILESSANIISNVEAVFTKGLKSLTSISASSLNVYATTLSVLGVTEQLSATSNIISNTISDLIFVNSLYLTRCIVIDIENNHGDSTNVGLKGIRFTRDGNQYNIGIPGQDYIALATSTDDPGPDSVWRLFYDTSTLVGTFDNWTSQNNPTHQRIICNMGIGILIEGIDFYNYHSAGTETDKGAKDIKVYFSNTLTTNKNYGESVPNSELVFDGTLDEHTAIDEEDKQSITLGLYTGSIDINSNINSDIVTGEPEELSATNNTTTVVDSTLYLGLQELLLSSNCNPSTEVNNSFEMYIDSDVLTSSINSYTNIDSLLVIGDNEELSSSVNITTDCIAPILINSLESTSTSTSFIYTTILSTGIEEILTTNISLTSNCIGYMDADLAGISNIISECNANLDININATITITTISNNTRLDVGMKSTCNINSNIVNVELRSGVSEILTAILSITSSCDSDLTVV